MRNLKVNFQMKSKENRIIAEIDEIIMVLCSKRNRRRNKYKNCSEKSEKERRKKVKVGKN